MPEMATAARANLVIKRNHAGSSGRERVRAGVEPRRGPKMTPDREAIMRTLEDCPDELGELRGVLLREHAWRMEHGL